jgi:uncharacterized membrane protein
MTPTSDVGRALPAPGAAAPGRTVRLSRALATACLLALVALGLAWELRLAPTGSGTLAWKVLPLVLGLPGVLRYRMSTYRWLSLLVWLYVAEGLVRATSDAGLSQQLAVVEVVLAVGLFAACAMHVRTRLRRDPG